MSYPYFYSKAEKGMLCFDPAKQDMKMTVTGCCQSKKIRYEDKNIYITDGNDKECYGGQNLQQLNNGHQLKMRQIGASGKQPERLEAHF